MKFGNNLRRLALLVLLGIVTVAPATLRAQNTRPMNVIVISLDQLSADHVHCLGNPRETSPNLDRLASDGVLFTHYYSVSPWTAPSYATLMTSLYPSMHGVTLMWHPGDVLIDPSTPVLAEIFKNHGYHTAAFVNNGVAGKALTGRGFDEYDQGQPNGQVTDITQRGGEAFNLAPDTTEKILPWLDQHKDGPFFLFVLFLEPHSPYNPPPADDIFKTDAYPNEANTGYDLQRGHLFRLAMLGDQKAIQRLDDLYDGKVHFVDRYVGKMMDHLKESGLSDNTLVVVTSDHGEMLYSHPSDFLTFDHRSLYDPVMHIPFMMSGPGLPKGKVIQAQASNIDSAPTILNLAGIAPPADAEGHSLVPEIDGKAKPEDKYVYGEEDVMTPLRSVRTERYKLIENLWTGRIQLFDTVDDPGELHDLYGHEPAVQAELLEKLHAWMAANHSSVDERMAQWKRYAEDPRNKEMITDDQTIGGHMLTAGGWHADDSGQNAGYDGGCLWTEAGDGSRTATWRVDNPLIGKYRIFMYYGRPSAGKLATNAKITIGTDNKPGTAKVNFTRGAGEWKLLGTFRDPRYVEITNAANGAVIADAVKFVRVGD